MSKQIQKLPSPRSETIMSLLDAYSGPIPEGPVMENGAFMYHDRYGLGSAPDMPIMDGPYGRHND